jgi:RHS repeat-associated protein
VGNLKQTSVASFTYDARHRLIGTSMGASSVAYQVNALGQRVQKLPGAGAASVFHYDKDGKLIAESDAAGNLKTSYLYLNDLPVGVIAPSPGNGACNVSAPQPNSGSTFSAFNNLTRLEVRSGRPNNADWQWGLGTNTQQAGSFVQAYLNWVSGRAYNFTLSYDGQGNGTYSVSYNGTQLFAKTWRGGLQVGNALQFYAKTTAGIGAGNFITVNLTSIDNLPVNATLQTAGDNLFDQASLTYLIPAQPTGFTVSGTIAFTFVGSAPPTGSRLNFLITAGNVTCQSSPEALYFISPDHLNTPRAVTDNNGNPVWTWASEPFGSMPPNNNPSGAGAFTFNLRFPGQYFDQETGLHYNYYRDYDPSTDRYVQSDPIGLRGGINTYAYVDGDPVNLRDPLGLQGFPIPPSGQSSVQQVGAQAMACALDPARCKKPPEACSCPTILNPGDVMAGGLGVGATAGGVTGFGVGLGHAAHASRAVGLIGTVGALAGPFDMAVAGTVLGAGAGVLGGAALVAIDVAMTCPLPRCSWCK